MLGGGGGAVVAVLLVFLSRPLFVYCVRRPSFWVALQTVVTIVTPSFCYSTILLPV